MKQFYTYIHCRPDGTPFYVGKGSGRRSNVFSSGRTTHHIRVVEKHGKDNILVFVFPCESEEKALADEIHQIAQLRRDGYDLVNLSDGGTGLSNPAPEVRIKLSNAKKGKILSAETKAKLSAANKGNKNCLGKKASAATRMKMSMSQKGKPGVIPSEETRQKLSMSHIGQVPWNKGKPSHLKGVPRSADTKAKISSAHKGKRLSEEHKEKLSSAKRGKTLSAEHKSKVAASLREFHQRKKHEQVSVDSH